MRKYFLKVNGSVSLLKNESFKYLWQSKIGLLLLIVLSFQVKNVIQSDIKTYSTSEQAVYHSYMRTLEGKITNKTIQYIEKEQAYYKKVMLQKSKVTNDSNASEVALSGRLMQFNFILEVKYPGFQLILNQYEGLKDKIAQGKAAYLVDEYAYQDLFLNSKKEIQSYLLCVILLILCLPCIFAIDYKNNMYLLLYSTPNGRNKLYHTKYALGILTTFFIGMTMYLPILILFQKFYGFQSLKASIHDMKIGVMAPSISIQSALLTIFITRFLLLILAATVILSLCIYFKNQYLTMIGSSGILLIPCLVLYNNSTLRFGWKLLESSRGFSFLICLDILLLFLTVLLYQLSKGKFTRMLR